MREEETKFRVDADFGLPDLDAALADLDGAATTTPPEQRRLTAVYWDTAGLRLARAGVTLRHRTGEDGPPWHLKLKVVAPGKGTAPGAVIRDELALDGDPGEPPGQFRALVTGWVRTEPLAPVATLETDRRAVVVADADGNPLVELVEDTVTVDGKAGFAEIEVERKDAEADPGLAQRVAGLLGDALRSAGAEPGGSAPKLVRALGDRATEPPDLPVTGTLAKKATADAAMGYTLRATARRLLEFDLGVRRDAPDAVHQARVCCRRLRSDLRTFGPLLGAGWAAPLDAELRWLAAALGGPRDAEVLRARLGATAKSGPLAALHPLDPGALARIDTVLADRHAAARKALSAAYTSDRYPRLLDTLVAAVEAPETGELAGQRATWVLPPLVEVVWQTLVKSVHKIEADGPDEAWHAARIRAKRVRYAAEAVAPVIGKPALRTAKAGASVQEILGEHQDAAIAADEWRDIAAARADDSALVLTCGRLIERERAAVYASRQLFAPIWAAADTEATTSWMRK